MQVEAFLSPAIVVERLEYDLHDNPNGNSGRLKGIIIKTNPLKQKEDRVLLEKERQASAGCKRGLSSDSPHGKVKVFDS